MTIKKNYGIIKRKVKTETEIKNVDILGFLQNLRPVDMSIVMLCATFVDIWAALSLSLKAKSTISKSLVKGLVSNLLVILLPFLLNVVVHLAFLEPENADFGYVHWISLLVTVMYLGATVGSITANYSAAYPEGKNFVTRFAYKYLPTEVSEKQKKHGLDDIKGL